MPFVLWWPTQYASIVESSAGTAAPVATVCGVIGLPEAFDRLQRSF